MPCAEGKKLSHDVWAAMQEEGRLRGTQNTRQKKTARENYRLAQMALDTHNTTCAECKASPARPLDIDSAGKRSGSLHVVNLGANRFDVVFTQHGQTAMGKRTVTGASAVEFFVRISLDLGVDLAPLMKGHAVRVWITEEKIREYFS